MHSPRRTTRAFSVGRASSGNRRWVSKKGGTRATHHTNTRYDGHTQKNIQHPERQTKLCLRYARTTIDENLRQSHFLRTSRPLALPRAVNLFITSSQLSRSDSTPLFASHPRRVNVALRGPFVTNTSVSRDKRTTYSKRASREGRHGARRPATMPDSKTNPVSRA